MRIVIVSVVGLCILLVSSVSRSEESIQGVVGCQCAPSDFTTANKEVVRQWFAALDAQDFDALTELMDEQFVVPARIIEGADRSISFWKQVMA